MRRPAAVVWACLFLALAAGGCFGRSGDRGQAGEGGGPGGFDPGVHPWPLADGSEWPSAVAGPFPKLPTERMVVTAPDGTDLNVWVVRPDLPEGARAPVVVWASPYWGTTQEAGDDPALWDNSWEGEATPVDFLVENGYAVGIMNLRGSGDSGGCFTMFGSEDWDDTALVVDTLGEQEWSNGRVAMMGLSYHGTTPWQAAVRNPEHLKTIVTAGMIHNLYTFFHTDQGAAQVAGPSFHHLIFGLTATAPRMDPPERIVNEWAMRLGERACPETAKVLTEGYRGDYGDARDEAFWEERRIVKDFPGITAAVLLTHGLRDLTGHATQEDPVWDALDPDLPKYQISGQWGHMFPNFDASWTETREDWHQDVLLPWFDFWLKGLGDPPARLGTVDYQDDEEGWHSSTSWPPAEAEAEALYLCGGGDATQAPEACPGATAQFVSAPAASDPSDYICGEGNGAGAPIPADPPNEKRGVVFFTAPLEEPVLLAGNPFALLEVESTLPGGVVYVHAYEVPPGEGGCGEGFRSLAFGAADLLHHSGNYVGEDFPVAQPTQVRVDLTNLAERIGAGSRIALVFAWPEAAQFEAFPFAPLITLHGGSHIVWPVVEGTLGGGAPPLDGYPPRPFIPEP